jgi:type I restriction enzyme, S subunit
MNIVCRLDEVCEIVMGQAPSGDAYNTDGKGWPLIAGAGDFGESAPQSSKFTTEATKLSRVGDIVLGIRASIGEKVIADGEYCLGRGVAGLRSRNALDPRFLWHWLGHISPQLTVKGKGATFKQVNKQDIGELPISLPSLQAQRRIAEVLDRAEALRAKRRSVLAGLDTLTQSIFLDLFGNPITNDKDWPVSELQDLASVERGRFTPRPRNDPSFYGGQFPFIQTGDISNCGGRLSSWTQTLNQRGIAVSRSFQPGTIVIAIVGATLGMTAILDAEVYCPDSVVGIQVQPKKAHAEYIERILRFWRPIFVAKAPETARANINLETLRPLRVPNPPVSLQSEFASLVKVVERLKAAHRISLIQLDTLFAVLQHRAFRGEL